MSCEPLDTSLIEERLREAVPALDKVGGYADMNAIKDLSGIRPGTAFVVLASERSLTQSDGAGQRRVNGRQQVNAVFGVITAARNFRDVSGEAALDEVRPLIGSVREALMGWTPDVTKFKQIVWVQGDVMDHNSSTLLWIDIFSTMHNIGGQL